MKNKILSIALLVGCTLCSCDDVLDALPKDKLPEETFGKHPVMSVHLSQTYIPVLFRWNMKCILVSMKVCRTTLICNGKDGTQILN